MKIKRWVQECWSHHATLTTALSDWSSTGWSPLNTLTWPSPPSSGSTSSRWRWSSTWCLRLGNYEKEIAISETSQSLSVSKFCLKVSNIFLHSALICNDFVPSKCLSVFKLLDQAEETVRYQFYWSMKSSLEYGVLEWSMVNYDWKIHKYWQELDYSLRVFNFFFTSTFCVEAALKVIALGPQHYFQDRWEQWQIISTLSKCNFDFLNIWFLKWQGHKTGWSFKYILVTSNDYACLI